jgi:hypothetical protein
VIRRIKLPEEMREYLSCDPETGVIIRAKHRSGGWHKRVGTPLPVTVRPHCHGPTLQVHIRFGSKVYEASRVVWFLCTGEQPPDYLDHINRDRTDNRMANLRPATASQNLANAKAWKRRDPSIPKGVKKEREGRFSARIRVDGKVYPLGSFPTAEEAHAAYISAARDHFGEFARAA